MIASKREHFRLSSLLKVFAHNISLTFIVIVALDREYYAVMTDLNTRLLVKK